jgi:hypothetical protein
MGANHARPAETLDEIFKAAARGDVAQLRATADRLGKYRLRVGDCAGVTAAHHAGSCGHIDVLKYLAVTLGPDCLCIACNNGVTVAHYAAAAGHLAVIDYLSRPSALAASVRPT